MFPRHGPRPGSQEFVSTIRPLVVFQRARSDAREPPFVQLKINRAIATRYDQLANSFLGMVHLAVARYWLKFVHAA